MRTCVRDMGAKKSRMVTSREPAPVTGNGRGHKRATNTRERIQHSGRSHKGTRPLGLIIITGGAEADFRSYVCMHARSTNERSPFVVGRTRTKPPTDISGTRTTHLNPRATFIARGIFVGEKSCVGAARRRACLTPLTFLNVLNDEEA